MNNVNLQIYSFGFDCGLSFLDKIRKAGELGYAGVELVRDYEGIPAQDVFPPMWGWTSSSRTCPIWRSLA